MKNFIYLTLLLTNLMVYSQEEVPFTVRLQQYIQGDISFIANNIVNRNTGKNANEAFNKTNGAKLNDQYEMQYIDIDEDNSTFSSSSANFNLDNSKEIVFAGLYWAANYTSEVGVSKNSGTAFENTERVDNFNEIKIKTPGQTSYQTIKGQILYDGFQHAKYKSLAPYVCFYDITSLAQKKASGTYTIANIKATQGFLDGGVSGGWTIYFVYKDATSKPKYITLYDGFAHVFMKPVSIPLSNFLTPKQGFFNTQITMSALEGDYSIDGDNVKIKNTTTNRYFPIGAPNRIASNFFNSSITIEKEYFLDRKPNSINTLGYDALLLTLMNKNNQLLANNCTETELKISSMGDKAYLFSVGFAIDLNPDFFETKQKEVAATETPKEIIAENNAIPKPEKMVAPKVEEKVYENNPVTEFQFSSQPKSSRKEKDIRTITVKTNLKQGFYLIANVFRYPKNRIRFSKFLEKNNIKSGYFLNPENNFDYVYLKYCTSQKEALEVYNSNLNNTYFEDYWILEINQ